jgi:molecular chaperone GrpE
VADPSASDLDEKDRAEPAQDGQGQVRADGQVGDAEQAVRDDLARLAFERDELRALAQRVQADFENYKKRVLRQQTDHLERAASGLVEKLLPVLDNCDLALRHGTQGVEPIYRSLLGVLEGEGLERIDPAGKPFDPTEHEAVAHEEGDGQPCVSEVLRAGYRWKGQLLRAAMVKVKG